VVAGAAAGVAAAAAGFQDSGRALQLGKDHCRYEQGFLRVNRTPRPDRKSSLLEHINLLLFFSPPFSSVLLRYPPLSSCRIRIRRWPQDVEWSLRVQPQGRSPHFQDLQKRYSVILFSLFLFSLSRKGKKKKKVMILQPPLPPSSLDDVISESHDFLLIFLFFSEIFFFLEILFFFFLFL